MQPGGSQKPLVAGMVGRFFPAVWRPPAQEISFAAETGFGAIQLRNDRPGELEALLRTPLGEVAAALRDAAVEPVLELLLPADPQDDPVAGLRASLPAIQALGIRRVHFHLIVRPPREDVPGRERALVPVLREAVALAREAGLLFGLEHNHALEELFATPEATAAALDAVPGLGFVWDVNHTLPREVAAYEALLPRATLVHLSDTPLPETNHHLPLGLGNVDVGARVAAVRRSPYDGPVVLEIGGHLRSGGYGKDTDEALRDSLARLRAAWAVAS